jgi:hypothetical protein
MRRAVPIVVLALAVSALTACDEPITSHEPSIAPELISNGTPTGDRLYGNVGALMYDYNHDGRIQGEEQACTGSLIAPTVFLTAAHCVLGWPEDDPQFYVTFDESLLPRVSGVIRATGFEFDHRYGHDQANLYDLAVVFLPVNATRGITPLQLPTLGLLDQLQAKGGLVDQMFVNVGYGTGATRTGPPAFPWTGLREYSLSEFMGLQPNWLGLLMNSNATGEGGDCYGDSGGPKFFEGNTRLIVATVTTGDVPCRATTWDQRLDTRTSREFLGRFVALP